MFINEARGLCNVKYILLIVTNEVCECILVSGLYCATIKFTYLKYVIPSL